MIKFVKLALFLLLLITLQRVVSSVSASQVEQKDYSILCFTPQQEHTQVPVFPYLLAELDGSLQTLQVLMLSVQRVLVGEYFSSLKNVLSSYANKEATLLQHWGKICSTKMFFYYRSTNEYYVFALRHIII